MAHEAVFSRQIPTGTFFFSSAHHFTTQTRMSIPMELGGKREIQHTNANGVASLEDHGNPLKDRKIL